MMSTKNDSRLSRKNLWGYAIGAIPTGLLGILFSLKYIELFFNELALLPSLFILGQVIYLTINAFNDPLMGQLSDRTNREKWGSRRLIYIKYGAPIWALTFILVWFPWSLDNQIVIFIHYIITISLFDTMLTLVVIVWMALLPEMTPSSEERNKAHFLSTLLGLVFVAPFFLIVGEMNPTNISFQIIAIIVAIISTLCLFVVAKFCEENPKFQKDKFIPIKKGIKEVFKSKTFLIYVGFYFSNVLLESLGLSYLFAYLLVLGEGGLIFFFLVYVVVGYGSNILCLNLQKKYEMRSIILRFGILRFIGTLIIFGIMVLSSLDFMIYIGYIWLTFFGGYIVFYIPMQYLAVDEDEIKQGTRREGIFLGTMALLTKPAQSLGPIIATLIFVSFGYIQGGTVQPESALLGVKILFLVVPALISGISLIFVYFYPLKGEKLRNMKKTLADLHQKKSMNV